MATNIALLRVKANAKRTCRECGSTEFIQGHHQIPKDDSTIIALCAECHSKKHPDVPRRLFFIKNHQPYWENISASSLAKQLDRHPRTIRRIAKRLDIAKGILSASNMALIEKAAVARTSHKVHWEVITTLLKIYKCLRCGHEWASRMDKPLVCPKCKSPYWAREKKEQLHED